MLHVQGFIEVVVLLGNGQRIVIDIAACIVIVGCSSTGAKGHGQDKQHASR